MTLAIGCQQTWTNSRIERNTERTTLGRETLADSFVTMGCRHFTYPPQNIEKTTSSPNVVLMAARQTPGLARLRQKQQQRLQAVQAYREHMGDPVDVLTNLMATLDLDQDRWQEIVDEPYG